MRRGFDWYGLTLPGMMAAGIISLLVSIPTGHGGARVVGWILLGMGIAASPLWIVTFVRARSLLVRVRDVAGVRFLAAPVDRSRGYFRQFGRTIVVVADGTALRAFRGKPVTEESSIPWAEVESIRVGQISIGRFVAPTLVIDRASADTAVLRVLHENGWMASFGYSERLLAELNALRPPRPETRILFGQAGASQSPPSGGSVSSTEAGRPPQGSGTAVTEP